VHAVDAARALIEDRRMDEPLDPREEARNRRRDRDAEAEARDLLRPGMGKVFKQIQDAQRRAADDERAVPRRRRRSR
jgi:hypothetical protein